MPKFTYTAIGKDGKNETATVEAANLIAAGHLLKSEGLMPLHISEEKTRKMSFSLGSLRGVPLKEKIVFIEDLQIMMKSGIAAPRALKIIAHQTKNQKFKKILEEIANGVESGKSLHETMEPYPKVFSHIFVSMVKVGEVSGNLEKALEYLAVQLERESDLKSKTKGAMIYPAVIVSAMIIIGLLMAIFVLPKLTSTFKEFDMELPLATRIIIAISDFMSGNAVLVLVLFGGLVASSWYFFKTPLGQQSFDLFLLRFPVISPIVKKINLARSSRVLSSMMASGIAIVESLQICSEAVNNVFYQRALAEASNQVKLGKPITSTLEQHSWLFPEIVVQMLEVGEETGTMEEILQQLALHYEAEVDNTMRNLSSIIEPLLLLLIGGVVGVLALALISPIYNISQGIS
jgi:type IV pilus assembly protein PilC